MSCRITSLRKLQAIEQEDALSVEVVGQQAEDLPPLLTGAQISLRLASLSPLRYPGSKRKMLPAIKQLIEDTGPRPELFIEPFCGGSSISLGLLEADAVERVLIADFDPLIASFWHVATRDTDALIRAMHKEPVTLENWDYWRKVKPRSPLRRALKCLFLNRTTFSGIVGGHAGPIGGRSQENYKIGCRFDKNSIEARLRNIQRLHKSGRILDPLEGRWQTTFRSAFGIAASIGTPERSMLFYLDPPYIEKATEIYDLPFTDLDHRILASSLDETARWILSYDAAPLILDLYRGRPGVQEFRVTHHYTMTGSRKSPVPGREVLFTNLVGPRKETTDG